MRQKFCENFAPNSGQIQCFLLLVRILPPNSSENLKQKQKYEKKKKEKRFSPQFGSGVYLVRFWDLLELSATFCLNVQDVFFQWGDAKSQWGNANSQWGYASLLQFKF